MAVTVITKDNFEETIGSGKAVIVDFFATWCGPCKALAPILEELSAEIPEDKQIVKLDIDENVDLARKYGVMSVPTLVLFKDGQPLAKMVGLRDKEQLLELVNYKPVE